LLRDRSNGARGQRRRQKRRACRRKPVASDCIATRTRDAWSTRAVLDSTSRSDLERSPLHDVKQHTPARRTWAGRGSFITSGRANRAAASAPFRCSQALKPSWRQRQEILSVAGDFARRPEQTRMADTGVGVTTAETTGHQRARSRPSGPTTVPIIGSRRPSGGARRDRTDDLLLAKQALSQLSYGPFGDQ
jgi:hypothetical protein